MKKRIICALMAAGIAAMARASCGGDSSSSSSGSSAAGDTASASQPETAESGETSAETAIDMEGDPYHVVFMYLNISEGEGYNEVAEAVNALSLEEINMETELLPVSYGTWTSTLQTMLASNERLDLFFDTVANAPTSISSGYIADWDDYIGQLPNVVEYYGDEMEAGRVGDFMAIIGAVKERPNNSGIICRTDIMTELGYSLEDFADVDPDNPASYDIFDEMFAAVKEAYPDMTAIAGQQALPSLCTYDSLSDGFGVLEDRGQTTTVTNWYESQQFKDLVTISKRWYDAGYYSADAVTNQDTGETLLKAGNLFSYLTNVKPNTDVEKLAQTGYEVYVIPIQQQVMSTSMSINAIVYSLANASEDPVKAAAFYNWCYQSGEFQDLINWGVEGVDWEEKEDGTAGYPEGKDASSVAYHQDFGWAYPNQFVGHAWEGNDPDVWEQYKEYNANLLKSKASGFVYDSTPVADQLAACTSVYDQYDNDLFTGSTDIEEGIAAMNEALYAAGLQAIMDEKQAQLNAWLAEQGE